MSAFIVSEDHIDALVSVALFGVAEVPALSGRWHTPYFGNPGHKVEVHNADKLGEMLVRENVASVQARYPNERMSSIEVYRYPFQKLPVPAVGVVAALKLVQCYEYQSCEHDGWDESAAKRFCLAFKDQLIRCLPGYDTAPWAI